MALSKAFYEARTRANGNAADDDDYPPLGDIGSAPGAIGSAPLDAALDGDFRDV